jgi:hypothetical protein
MRRCSAPLSRSPSPCRHCRSWSCADGKLVPSSEHALVRDVLPSSEHALVRDVLPSRLPSASGAWPAASATPTAQPTLPRCRRPPTPPRALGRPPARHPPRGPGAGRHLRDLPRAWPAVGAASTARPALPRSQQPPPRPPTPSASHPRRGSICPEAGRLDLQLRRAGSHLHDATSTPPAPYARRSARIRIRRDLTPRRREKGQTWVDCRPPPPLPTPLLNASPPPVQEEPESEGCEGIFFGKSQRVRG